MNRGDSIHAAEPDVKAARDTLAERLLSGDKVNGLNLADLLDCALNGEDDKLARSKLAAISRGASGERAALVDQLNEWLVERYLDAHPLLAEDLAIETAAEA